MHEPSCSRTLLDSAFENEAKCKSETEAAKREVLRLSDKLEQVQYWNMHVHCTTYILNVNSGMYLNMYGRALLSLKYNSL